MTIRSGLCRLFIGHVTIRRKTVDSNRKSYDVHVGIVTTPTCRADGWPTLHKHTTPDAFMSIRRRRADIVLTTNRYRASVFPMSICYLGCQSIISNLEYRMPKKIVWVPNFTPSSNFPFKFRFISHGSLLKSIFV